MFYVQYDLTTGFITGTVMTSGDAPVCTDKGQLTFNSVQQTQGFHVNLTTLTLEADAV